MLSIKKITKLFFTAGAIFAIIVFCAREPGVFDYLVSYNWYYVALLCGLYGVFYLLNAYILLFLIRPYGENIVFLKVLSVNQLSAFVNYFLPFRVAGVGIKVVLLKKLFGVSFGATVGTFTISTFIFSFVSLFSLLVAFAFLDLSREQYAGYFEAVFIVVLFVVSFFCFLIIDKKYQLLEKLNPPRVLLDLKCSMISASKKSLSVVFFLYVLQVIITSYMTYVLFLGAGYPLSFFLCLFMTSIGHLSGVLALTPANIGVKEISYVGAGALFGVPADVIMAVLLLDRFIQIFLLAVGLPFVSYSGVKIAR